MLIPLTASFWVKSTKTGTFILELYDLDNDRQISKSYTVSDTNTWEFKTVTFAGDTTGAFTNDNGDSLSLNFWLGAGTNFTSGTLNTSWASAVTANRAVGQVNIADNTANDFLITGVQLEAGEQASGFEFMPFDIDLFRCRRYFETNFAIGTAPANGVSYTLTDFYSNLTAFATTAARTSIFFKNTKRVVPTITYYNVTGLGAGATAGRWQLYDGSWGESSGAVTNGEVTTGVLSPQVPDTYVANYSYMVSGGFTADAEL
jgi:hypothetical protein